MLCPFFTSTGMMPAMKRLLILAALIACTAQGQAQTFAPGDYILGSGIYGSLWTFRCYRNYQYGGTTLNGISIAQQAGGSIGVILTPAGKVTSVAVGSTTVVTYVTAQNNPVTITYTNDTQGKAVAANIVTTGFWNNNTQYPANITVSIKRPKPAYNNGTFLWVVKMAATSKVYPGMTLMSSYWVPYNAYGFVYGSYLTILYDGITKPLSAQSKPSRQDKKGQ